MKQFVGSMGWKPVGFVLASGAVAIALSLSGCAEKSKTVADGGTSVSPVDPDGTATGERPGYGKPDPCEHKDGAVSVWFGQPSLSDGVMQLEVEISSDDEVPALSVHRVAFDQRTRLVCALGEGRCQQLLLADSPAGAAIRSWLGESKEASEHSGSIEMLVRQAKKCAEKPEPLE